MKPIDILNKLTAQLCANVANTAEQNLDLFKARGLTDEQIAKIKEVANARAEQCAVQHSAKQY